MKLLMNHCHKAQDDNNKTHNKIHEEREKCRAGTELIVFHLQRLRWRKWRGIEGNRLPRFIVDISGVAQSKRTTDRLDTTPDCVFRLLSNNTNNSLGIIPGRSEWVSEQGSRSKQGRKERTLETARLLHPLWWNVALIVASIRFNHFINTPRLPENTVLFILYRFASAQRDKSKS